MKDYSKGKIYMISSERGGIRYYGSTTRTLDKRLQDHRYAYDAYLKEKTNWVSSFQVLEYDDAKIVLIEDAPSQSKAELEHKERIYIINNECVNRNRPREVEESGGILEYMKKTTKRRKELYPEKVKASDKKYYDKNVNTIKERQNRRVTCECGKEYSYGGVTSHRRSKFHKDWIDSQKDSL